MPILDRADGAGYSRTLISAMAAQGLDFSVSPPGRRITGKAAGSRRPLFESGVPPAAPGADASGPLACSVGPPWVSRGLNRGLRWLVEVLGGHDQKPHQGVSVAVFLERATGIEPA